MNSNIEQASAFPNAQPNLIDAEYAGISWSAPKLKLALPSEPILNHSSQWTGMCRKYTLHSAAAPFRRSVRRRCGSIPKAAPEYVAFRNGSVNVHTGEKLSHTWRFWTHSIRPFDWDPAARCPVWERILNEYWPDDEETKAFVEEWMGYCMTEDVRFHKGVMLIGKGRNGKGTIAHVIRRLVGEASYVPLNFDTWVKTENSTASVIGCRVGCFGDVRLKPGKHYGQEYDPGGLSSVSQALLLQITGGDPVSLGRKYLGTWQGILPTKIILVSNEVPNLNDPSLALVKQFIKVELPTARKT